MQVPSIRLVVHGRDDEESPLYFSMCRKHFIESEKAIAEFNTMSPISGFLSKPPKQVLKMLAVLTKINEHQYISIVFGVMCLEAFIFDYSAHYLGDPYTKENLDKLKLIQKYLVIPRIVTGKDFPKEGQAFEHLKKLVKARNDLVHYRSKPQHTDFELLEERWKEREECRNPFNTVVEVLTELKKLDDTAEWWKLQETGTILTTRKTN